MQPTTTTIDKKNRIKYNKIRNTIKITTTTKRNSPDFTKRFVANRKIAIPCVEIELFTSIVIDILL